MRRALPLAAALLLPLAATVAMTRLRSSWMEPMMSHRFGWKVVGLAAALTVLGTLGVAVATYRVESRAGRVILLLLSVLLGTLPAVCAVVFGPVVFGFWYGAAPGVE